MEKAKSDAFNVMLPDQLRERLDKWAERVGTSRGHVIRTALDAFLEHSLEEIPRCANGGPCYVPHMHPRRQVPGRPVAVPGKYTEGKE